MSTYAQNTQVSTDRSLSEIKNTLMRYGADQFAVMESRDKASVAFTWEERQVRFDLPLPSRNSREFTLTPTGKTRTASSAQDAWEKACRQKWRALALVVKAKLEAVESGISTFDREFFPNIILPGGASVFDTLAPAVTDAIHGNPAGLLQITQGGDLS
ncbi:hypothetical protein FYJ24_09500 [Actinomycetaceae bacterium WB03_NA08]|uniref:Uncharacterized protein n=1 Tax=Scrofimicrobium canadense TaxID=2652290 RepID=A0A6N7VT89_9ACTO|nr:hypothetical protein [Scrofimicrobium canadense]MSS84994.1 hypothetical protein [Scrofimicrobium canadense]